MMGGRIRSAACFSVLPCLGVLFLANLTSWPSAALLYGLSEVQDADVETVESVCVIRDWAISEASGMACSLHQPECLWVHNDSGDEPRLFLVNRDGTTRGILTLTSVQATDWEDMCAFRADNQNWLLIADSGDNSKDRGKTRPGCQLLLVKEPQIAALNTGEPIVQKRFAPFAVVKFEYPGGAADCESVAVDVAGRQILLLTKAGPGAAVLYRIPLELREGRQRFEVEEIRPLGIPWATAMDLSPDGNRLAIVNPLSGVLFERQAGESWKDACSRMATVLTLPARKQGETVCFEADGERLLVGSEGRWQTLWRVSVPRKNLAPP
jgi:hypothetical protein